MDINSLLTVAANFIILLGVLVFVVAAGGLFKFRDTYQRISAVGTAAGPGISLIVIGVFLTVPSWQNAVQLLIIIFLQLSTSSIGTMSIARSAYLTGVKMQPGYFDQLAEDQAEVEDTSEIDEDGDIAQEFGKNRAQEPPQY